MLDTLRPILRSQFRAALAMLESCITLCPAEHWETPIAKYPFWQVAYHTLCFIDCYLSPSNDEFLRTVNGRTSAHTANPAAFNPHPRGMAELEDEYPSRQFTREELLAYTALCRDKIDAVLAAETEATLAGPSGFEWIRFSRLELHLYNLRHIQHHTGQLCVSLRKVGLEPKWIGRG